MGNKGKFINTTHTDNINTMISTAKTLLNNPYYIWSNKQATPVDYYNINKEMSTLDEGFKNIVSDVGKDSSLWFNLITDFYIYGIDQVQIQMEHGEFGAESGEITGEAFILPNTITPYPGDMFSIKYIKEKFMFRIISVSHDTLENGSNIYKVMYKLESARDVNRELHIKNRYQMIVNNVGTGFNPIIRDEKYFLIDKLESVLYSLKVFYQSTFYSPRVQSFIFKCMEDRFYDPYMTQFLINNSLLTGGDEYIYMTQQLPLNNSFPIDYDKSIFRCLETDDYSHIRRYNYKGIGRYIDSSVSIFATRIEDYFQIDLRYSLPESHLFGIVPCFNEELIEGIEGNKLYDDKNAIYNIIIKYANHRDITEEDIDNIDFDIYDNITLFYSIPCIIFCLENHIKRMMVSDRDE